MLVDDAPNDLDQTNLHDVTINNVNSIDLLKMDHAARKKIPGVPIKRSYPAILGAVRPDYKEFYKKLGDAGLKSGTETGQTLGTGLGAVAGGTAGATAGAVGAHLATKDKKEKSDK